MARRCARRTWSGSSSSTEARSWAPSRRSSGWTATTARRFSTCATFARSSRATRTGRSTSPWTDRAFATKCAFLVAPDERVVVHAATQAEAQLAAQGLRSVALLELAGYALAPQGDERLAPIELDEVERLLAAGEVEVLDVREKEERDDGLHRGDAPHPVSPVARVRRPRRREAGRDDLQHRLARCDRRERPRRERHRCPSGARRRRSRLAATRRAHRRVPPLRQLTPEVLRTSSVPTSSAPVEGVLLRSQLLGSAAEPRCRRGIKQWSIRQADAASSASPRRT